MVHGGFVDGTDRPSPDAVPDIWWPGDRSWCVATDIDLCHTYVGGSQECVEAIPSHPSLEALPTTLDVSTYLISDSINAPEKFQGGSE